MPPNTVCVTRSGKWGNPFVIRERRGKFEVISTLPCDIESEGVDRVIVAVGDTREEAARKAVAIFKTALLSEDLPVHPHHVREQLRGKNLACFCAPGSPCHADVLLDIANEDSQ